jgi:hypothetical protein
MIESGGATALSFADIREPASTNGSFHRLRLRLHKLKLPTGPTAFARPLGAQRPHDI